MIILMSELLSIPECQKILQNKTNSIKDRYNCLYHLRTHASDEAAKALRASYPHLKSDLLQHEVMFILGQIKRPQTIDYLISVLQNTEEAPVVRHEAGEALSNFMQYKDKVIPVLESFTKDPELLVSQTARIALEKIKNSHLVSRYGVKIPGSLEPAAPFSEPEFSQFLLDRGYLKEGEFFMWPMVLSLELDKVQETISNQGKLFERVLFDPELHEFFKYRLLYLLRDKADGISLVMLTRVMEKTQRQFTSALLRHEVAYIFGQLEEKLDNPYSKAVLAQLIKDPDEEAVVRHEAIMAFAEVFGATQEIVELRSDPLPLVAESAFVVIN